MTGPSESDSMKFTAFDTTSLARRASLATQATARVARCQRSSWSTSATETLKRCLTFSFIPFRTWRLPFSESTSPRCSSTSPSATAADTLLVLQGAGHFFGRVRFDHVPHADVGHALDPDPAVLALEDLAHVALEAPDRADLPLADRLAAAPHPDLRRAGDLALVDEGAGDAADVLDGKERADLRLAERHLADDRRQHPLEGSLDIVDRLVDDVVALDVDALDLGLLHRLRLGLDVEADDDRVGGRGQHHVGLRDRPPRPVDPADLALVGGEPLEGVLQGLEGAVDVALEDHPQLLPLARLDLLVEVGQGDPHGRGDLALLLLPAERDLARFPLVAEHGQSVAGGRHAGEPEDLHGVGRPGLPDPLAAVVEQRAHAPGVLPGHQDVALVERALLDEHGRDGAAPAVELRLDDHAPGGSVWVGLQLHDLGLEGRHLEELIDADPLLGGGVHEDRLAAPLLRHEPEVRQLLAHAVGVRLRLVDLVDRHDHRNVGRLGVVDRLDRLRLDAVVGPPHPDDDVGR